MCHHRLRLLYGGNLPLPGTYRYRLWREAVLAAASDVHNSVHHQVSSAREHQFLSTPQTCPKSTLQGLTGTGWNSDFIALLLQAGGGTIVSIATTKSFSDVGLHIADAGLCFQVASLLVFIGLCAHFARSCRRHPEWLDPRFARLRGTKRFRFFLWCAY